MYPKLLSGNEFLELVAYYLSYAVRLVSVYDGGERRGVLAVDADIQSHQAVCPEADLLEGHGRIPFRSTLQLVEEVGDHLCQRELE